jgi:hypothetical protein
MSKRDDYENTFRTIEETLGSSSGKNPAGVALKRHGELKSDKAGARKLEAEQRKATGGRTKGK